MGTNVIDLAAYRGRLLRPEGHPVLYLSNDGAHLGRLAEFPFLTVEDIRSLLGFRRAWTRRRPELVLLDADLDWACPVDIIQSLSEVGRVPVAMICDDRTKSEPSLLKRAFAAGLHDTLYQPLCPEELELTLRLLLKLGRPARELP